MVNAWNVGELDQMVLPPCHYGFQVYTRELTPDERVKYFEKNPESWPDNEISNIPKRAISLMWNQRSVDTFLGLPFNIASYGLLLEIIAKEVNMVPDELIGNLGDTHLYLNHIEQAKEQIGRPLTDEERYHIWFNNNFETGMERFFDPENIPDYDDPYYTPTPTHTREPFELPTLYINDLRSDSNSIIRDITKWSPDDFKIQNYKSHPSIKAPLSN
jgi:thymidylate synthase